MSEMRSHLDAGREAYSATRYPGDLALQMIPMRRNWWPRIIGTVVAGAAAAIIVVVLLNQSIMQPIPRAGGNPPTTQDSASVTLPGLPEMPQATAVATTLDQPIFLPSLPLFPTLADVTAETNQLPTTNQSPTTQESL